MDAAEKALARNDRYLSEFVERLRMCPFAQRCRETGKLDRRVLLGKRPLDDAQAAVRAVEAQPEDAVEVALLIFPDFDAGPREFESFLAEVRTAARAFYCVAFHPELPEDLADPNRAVAFVRRSPDPTIQMVRASLLERVRGEQAGGSMFVDARQLSAAELLALSSSPETLSERIARENLDTLRRLGPERLREDLARLRKR